MRILASKYGTIIGLICFAMVILIPPLIYGYVYPNIGDDSAEHLNHLTDMVVYDYQPFGNVYTGYLFVAYPIKWLHQQFGWDVDTMFLWTNYIALILVGVVLYSVFSKLVDRKTGWLALLVALFCSQGLLFQFYYGVLFNMINMGIILPLLLFFIVRYIVERKRRDLTLAILFVLLFSMFHASGIYLPVFILGLATVYVIYCKYKRRKTEWKLVGLGLAGGILSVIALNFFIPEFRHLTSSGFVVQTVNNLSVPIMDYLWSIVSVSVFFLLLIFVPLAIERKFDLSQKIKTEPKVLMVMLGLFGVILAVPTFTKMTLDPWRQALDLATILSLLTTVLASTILLIDKRYILTGVIALLVTLGVCYNLTTWFGYNSAITEVDKRAIEYVNTLDGETYNCSTTIAPWIYNRFLKQGYTDKESSLLIVRNLPMTPRSTEGNIWYKEPIQVYYPDETYDKAEVFRGEETTVVVYQKSCSD